MLFISGAFFLLHQPCEEIVKYQNGNGNDLFMTSKAGDSVFGVSVQGVTSL